MMCFSELEERTADPLKPIEVQTKEETNYPPPSPLLPPSHTHTHTQREEEKILRKNKKKTESRS